MKIESIDVETKKVKKFKKAIDDLVDNKIGLEKLEEAKAKIPNSQFKGKNVSGLVPQLVNFQMGDILRCMFSSKEIEVTAVYREILRISKANP